VPIYLPAILCRQLVLRSLAGSAALALSPRLAATDERADQDSRALLSGIHAAA